MKNIMESKWRKAKTALGLNLCVYVPRTLEDSPLTVEASGRVSDVSIVSPAAGNSDFRPSTPTPSSSGLRLSKTGSRSSKRTCAICLGTMKPGQGHALFTAECSHTFHFHCIASNVKHGNQICPVCRAKWKEVPFQGPSSELFHGRARINPVDWPQEDGWMTVLRRLPPAPPRLESSRHLGSLFHASEPSTFSDDEPLDSLVESAVPAKNSDNPTRTVEIKTYPEFDSVAESTTHENFTILIHLKAPFSSSTPNSSRSPSSVFQTFRDRAPVDLVTVLDVSGSMAGTKLALLKRAMSFVIQNLGPSDRLSVVSFSSTARRLFPLRRMSESGRQHALQAVNSLISSGGTNIAEGLRKGAKVLEERQEKNPVCSIILLSDGQDTYNAVNAGNHHQPQDLNYQSLLPFSIRRVSSQCQIPVHAFGFGADHDSASMHSISEASGGTFSFIEAESVIQDAFAQCIGGLLSVVVQGLQVWVQCASPGVSLGSIRAGSYASTVSDQSRRGVIDVGDLYADEERDFLVCVTVPAGLAGQETPLIKVGCDYKDSVSKEALTVAGEEVRIQRQQAAVGAGQQTVCVEVDRQRNRLEAAEAMAEARAFAERGDLAAAVSVLGNRRSVLSESVAARAGDRLCCALDAELKEMQERMASRHVYETSGRAYVLSGLSSHSWQRATARGDSTDTTSLVYGYQTPSMVDMLMRSQTMAVPVTPQPSRPPPHPVRPCRSFPVQPQPR